MAVGLRIIYDRIFKFFNKIYRFRSSVAHVKNFPARPILVAIAIHMGTQIYMIFDKYPTCHEDIDQNDQGTH